MKTKLSKTFIPDEGVLALAKSKGMPIEDWLYHLLPEWKLFWITSKETKKSWGTTFWNWAKLQWEDVDKRRLYRKTEQMGYCQPERRLNPRKYVQTNAPTTAQTQPLSQEKRIQQADKWFPQINTK